MLATDFGKLRTAPVTAIDQAAGSSHRRGQAYRFAGQGRLCTHSQADSQGLLLALQSDRVTR